MAVTPSAFLHIVDGLLRAGDVRKARLALATVEPAKIPREERAAVAALARRAQLPELALQLLGPLVRGRQRGNAPATPREKAEYAEALNKAGAHDEAIARLRELEPREVPEAALYLASALISHWDYAAAVAPLTTFLELSRDGYLRAVAKLNLAAAHIIDHRHPEAETLLADLRRTTKAERWLRLHGNSLELSAGNAVYSARWKEAEAFLGEAERALGPRARLDALFLEKWRALLPLHREGPTPEALRAIERLRRKAIRLGHGETWRECDRQEAIHTKDAALVARVYYGTPHAEFRRRLRDALGPGFPLEDGYDWAVGESPGKTRHFALATGKVDGGATPLRPGSLGSRMLHALGADLYRPATLGSLHARAFPGQYFNPDSSPGRVHKALQRLRADLKTARLKLRIVENEGTYRLEATGPVTVRLGEPAKDRHDALVLALRKRWPQSPFSLGDALAVVTAQRRVLQRALGEACEAGSVERLGAGKRTRYRFR